MLRIVLLVFSVAVADSAMAGEIYNILSGSGEAYRHLYDDLIPEGAGLPTGYSDGTGSKEALPALTPPGAISCETSFNEFSGSYVYDDRRATDAYCNPAPRTPASGGPIILNKELTDPSNFGRLTPPPHSPSAPEPTPESNPYNVGNTFAPVSADVPGGISINVRPKADAADLSDLRDEVLKLTKQ